MYKITYVAEKRREDNFQKAYIGGLRGLIYSLTFATKGGQNVRVLY